MRLEGWKTSPKDLAQNASTKCEFQSKKMRLEGWKTSPKDLAQNASRKC